MPDGEKRDFRVPMMFHPSLDVFDLDDAERWYKRVFGAKSTSLESVSKQMPSREDSGYPRNYSTFTPIGDVLFDTIDPSRYVFNGVQKMPPLKAPRLRLISYYVDGMNEVHRALRRNGIRVTNQMDEVIEGDTAPTSFGSTMPLIFTLPEDTGLRYSLFPPPYATMIDPRTRPGWVLPEASGNPLGIERCAHHTILTDRPERAVKFHTVLGGEVVHRGRNAFIGATCTYIHLAGSIMEIAVPDKDTAAYDAWRKTAPDDTYRMVTWKVADLAAAERHLTAQGIRIGARTPDTIVTEPVTSLGVPWGFTTTLMPGDPRA